AALAARLQLTQCPEAYRFREPHFLHGKIVMIGFRSKPVGRPQMRARNTGLGWGADSVGYDVHALSASAHLCSRIQHLGLAPFSMDVHRLRSRVGIHCTSIQHPFFLASVCSPLKRLWGSRSEWTKTLPSSF